MAKDNIKINFDPKQGDEKQVREFFRSFFESSRKAQRYKHEEFQRVYNMYKLSKDMTNRDPNRSNLMVPKMYSTIETIVPVYVDALLGLRPYIPIELTNQKNSGIGDSQTLLLDTILHDSDFFWEAVKWIKYTLMYGTGFMECVPIYEKKTIKTMKPQFVTDARGNPTPAGSTPVTETYNLLKLKIRAYAPWQIYRDPTANTIDDSRGIIKFRGMISRRQIREMAKMGAFPDFDLDKLKPGESDYKDDEWSKNMARDIGVDMPEEDDDVGIWTSYESKGRYIDMWNFQHVLRDGDNPYNHNKINLTRAVNTPDPNDHNDWFGIGEGRPIEDLCHALNDAWNQTIDNHNQINEGVIFYDEDALSVDQLVMVAGNRIPVTPELGKTIQDSIYERPQRGLPRDHYAIPDTFDRMADETSGVHEVTRGESSRKVQTAREAILLKQAGDSRIKLKIKMGEQMGLKDFGEKAISIIDQFSTPRDVISRIGLEAASKLPTVNPENVDGGYQFAFKGSGRMADAQIKRQDAKDLFQLMAGNTTIRQDWLANFVLERFEVSDQERRKAVLPDMQAMQLKMMMDQASAQGGGTVRGVDNTAIGGSAGNTPTGRDQNEKLGMAI